MATAPNAIRNAANAITGSIGGAVFSGIVGDAAHSFGYHLAYNQLPPSDYSKQLAKDTQGINVNNASALDISLPRDQMIAVTGRLLEAARNRDPRLYAVREFCGTTNGSVTHGYDLAYGREHTDEWDDSHLWHVHVSFYRSYADDPKAMAAFVEVFNGTGSSVGGGALGEEDFLMALSDAQQIQLAQRVDWLFENRNNIVDGNAYSAGDYGPAALSTWITHSRAVLGAGAPYVFRIVDSSAPGAWWVVVGDKRLYISGGAEAKRIWGKQVDLITVHDIQSEDPFALLPIHENSSLPIYFVSYGAADSAKLKAAPASDVPRTGAIYSVLGDGSLQWIESTDQLNRIHGYEGNAVGVSAMAKSIKDANDPEWKKPIIQVFTVEGQPGVYKTTPDGKGRAWIQRTEYVRLGWPTYVIVKPDHKLAKLPVVGPVAS